MNSPLNWLIGSLIAGFLYHLVVKPALGFKVHKMVNVVGVHTSCKHCQAVAPTGTETVFLTEEQARCEKGVRSPWAWIQFNIMRDGRVEFDAHGKSADTKTDPQHCEQPVSG